MRILLVEPGKKPIEKEINGSLESMQEAVGGLIQAVYPFEEIALVCNDEGKLMGLPLNRALRDADGHVYDVIAGTFFLCGAPSDSDSFASLTEAQIKTYSHVYEKPDRFLRDRHGLMIL